MSGDLKRKRMASELTNEIDNIMMRAHEQSIRSFDFKAYYDNEALSDVTVKFSGKEVKCHKLILCTKSEYFNKQLGPDSKFAESEQRVVTLHEDPLEAVEAMLSELYTFDCIGKFGEKARYPSFHLRVYVTTKKYLLEDLAAKSFVALARTTAAAHGNLDVIKNLLDSHQPYQGDHEDLDHHITFVWKSNLSRLISIPECREHITEDRALRQEVIDRLAFFETLEASGKIIRCAHCADTNYAVPVTAHVECECCHRIL